MKEYEEQPQKQCFRICYIKPPETPTGVETKLLEEFESTPEASHEIAELIATWNAPCYWILFQSSYHDDWFPLIMNYGFIGDCKGG